MVKAVFAARKLLVLVARSLLVAVLVRRLRRRMRLLRALLALVVCFAWCDVLVL
jgi:hypothetical protein